MNPKKVLLPGRGREERESKRTDEPYKEQCTKRDELKKKKKVIDFRLCIQQKGGKVTLKMPLPCIFQKGKAERNKEVDRRVI